MEECAVDVVASVGPFPGLAGLLGPILGLLVVPEAALTSFRTCSLWKLYKYEFFIFIMN